MKAHSFILSFKFDTCLYMSVNVYSQEEKEVLYNEAHFKIKNFLFFSALLPSSLPPLLPLRNFFPPVKRRITGSFNN